MKAGYGVFFQYGTGRTVCLLATDEYSKAAETHARITQYMEARRRFAARPEMAADPEDRKLLELFERLEKKYGGDGLIRSGVGEILLAIKEV